MKVVYRCPQCERLGESDPLTDTKYTACFCSDCGDFTVINQSGDVFASEALKLITGQCSPEAKSLIRKEQEAIWHRLGQWG